MKLWRKLRALFNKLLALAQNIRRTPGRLNRALDRLAQSLATIRSGARRWGRNADADRARLYAAKIQSDLARQGMKSEITKKPLFSKKTIKRIKFVEFMPPLVVTSTGVMMRVATGSFLPAGVQIADLENQKVIDTLAQAVGQDVYVNAKDPRAGTLIQIAEVSAVDGIPRLVWSNEVTVPEDNPLSFVVGKGKNGNVIADLESMPHYLVAGATRQGKSVHMWHLITTIARRNNPVDVRMALFDLKKGSMFHPLCTLPHLMFPIIEETDQVMNAMQSIAGEMEKRYTTIRGRGQSTVKEYNRLPNVEKFPLIFVGIDEVAEITTNGDVTFRRDGTALLSRLLRLSGGAGIHITLSTQHPNAKVLKPEIRGNITEAIAFRTGKRTGSEIILDRGGAEKILLKGRALFKLGADLIEVQTPLIQEGGGVHGIYSLVSEIVGKWNGQAAAQAGEAVVAAGQAAQARELLIADMLRFAQAQMGGKFTTRTLFKEFKGRVIARDVESIAEKLEKEGVLSSGKPGIPRRIIATCHETLPPVTMADSGANCHVTSAECASVTSLEDENTPTETPANVWLLKPGDLPENAQGPYTQDHAIAVAIGEPGARMIGQAELDALKRGETLWGDTV